MKKILIKNYRGFDIEFDVDFEKFECICTAENTKESTSFSAIKKFIDEYKKTNQDFKPFWVELIPNKYKSEKLKVIGIRKDGRFVAENSKGEKNQIADFELNRYMIVKPENEMVIKKFYEQIEKEKKQEAENFEANNQIMSELNIITLKEYKNSL